MAERTSKKESGIGALMKILGPQFEQAYRLEMAEAIVEALTKVGGLSQGGGQGQGSQQPAPAAPSGPATNMSSAMFQLFNASPDRFTG